MRILAPGLALAALALVGCGAGAPPVVRVATFPQGPTGAVAPFRSASGIYAAAAAKPAPDTLPLRVVAAAIPRSLPPNPPQACDVGAEVELTLSTGRQLVYGPCVLPASIARLREALVRAAVRTLPPRVTAPDAWKSLVRDWYDGTLGRRRYPCEVVRLAIAHLPPDPMTYSNVWDDLQAYARVVCR